MHTGHEYMHMQIASKTTLPLLFEDIKSQCQVGDLVCARFDDGQTFANSKVVFAMNKRAECRTIRCLVLLWIFTL